MEQELPIIEQLGPIRESFRSVDDILQAIVHGAPLVTRPARRTPLAYVQVKWTANTQTSGTALNAGDTFQLGSYIPLAATVLTINIEGQSVRYNDAEPATPTRGMLYVAGTTLDIALHDSRQVTLCGVDGTIANIILYKIP